MTRYVALLRGINVGSTNRIGMPDLRRIVADLGHDDVRTYLQSGNVVFGAGAGRGRGPAADRLADGIRRAIADELGLDVPVLVRSGQELAVLADGNPYLGSERDEVKLLVAVLAEPPDPGRTAALTVPGTDTAAFTVADSGREIYLHYPDGYGRTKFSNAYLEKRLGVASTTRNWKTIRALTELTAP